MKKFIIALAFVAMTALPAQAQSLVAHINIDSVLVEMPEYKQAMEDLQAEQAKFESEAKEMNAELESAAAKLQDESQVQSWTELRRRQEEQQLQVMYNNIQTYLQQAQQQLQQMEVEKLTPVLQKLQDAIDAAAKANKVSYVLDASKSKGLVIFADGGFDLAPAVKEILEK